MKIEINKNEIFERKTDARGRISLPASKYKNQKLEIAVLNQEEIQK